MATEIKKIKTSIKTGKISIEYQVSKPGGNEPDEFAFSSSDKAMPSFHETLQALSEDVVDMCELPDSYKDRIIVKGVSFSFGGENSTMGATIIASMTLNKSNVPLNLITPHKASSPYSEGDGDPAQLLSDDCIDRLHDVIEEAEKYIKGVRAQGDMFAEKPEINVEAIA